MKKDSEKSNKEGMKEDRKEQSKQDRPEKKSESKESGKHEDGLGHPMHSSYDAYKRKDNSGDC